MRIIFLLFLIMLFVLGISGCGELGNEGVLVQPSSLGQEFSTFEPPAKPAEIAKPVDIAEPAGVISLRQALALALMHNPELKAFSWDVRISEAKQLQAGLGVNPELKIEVEDAGGGGARRDFDAAETTIALSQLIEMGGKLKKRVKVATLEKEVARLDYQAKRLDVFTGVAKAFIAVLTAQRRLELTEELLGLSEELVGTVARRVDSGKDSPLEKTKADIAHSNVKIQHRQAVGDLEFARKQLVSTWAGGKPEFEMAAGELDSLTQIPSLDQLTNLLWQNPDIVRWDLQVDKSKASLELEKAKAVSDITLTGGMQRFNETEDNAVVFGISFPLPISDRNQAGKAQAAYALAKAWEDQRAAHSKIQMDLAKAYRGLSNSFAEATELDKNVLQAAESVFQASKTGYSQGKFGYLNVLDSQRTLFEAKAQYINALGAFHTAKTDVERLIANTIESIDLLNEESK